MGSNRLRTADWDVELRMGRRQIFFDSLPRELYESIEIDGAGEFRIFWLVTMSLSQPILAVIALGAFTGPIPILSWRAPCCRGCISYSSAAARG